MQAEANVINKFNSSISTLCRNKAIQLVKTSHVTYNYQPVCFISTYCRYATLNFFELVYDINSCFSTVIAKDWIGNCGLSGDRSSHSSNCAATTKPLATVFAYLQCLSLFHFWTRLHRANL